MTQIQRTSLPSKLVIPEGETVFRTGQRQQWQRRRKPRKEQAAEKPQGGWRKRRDRGASDPEQGSLVRHFPVFISTHKLFHPVFFPIPVRTGSERDAVWEFDFQPKLTLSDPVEF